MLMPLKFGTYKCAFIIFINTEDKQINIGNVQNSKRPVMWVYRYCTFIVNHVNVYINDVSLTTLHEYT